jgi:hypothetical protein
MKVKACIDPCFTLISEWLIATNFQKQSNGIVNNEATVRAGQDCHRRAPVRFSQSTKVNASTHITICPYRIVLATCCFASHTFQLRRDLLLNEADNEITDACTIHR